VDVQRHAPNQAARGGVTELSTIPATLRIPAKDFDMTLRGAVEIVPMHPALLEKEHDSCD
jgi:hypothetical protein